MRAGYVVLFVLFSSNLIAQDTLYIKVHFLYGSKPKKEYRLVERKWFGGILGGHVGVEVLPNNIVDFGPSGEFHYISHRHEKHSRFTTHDTTNFYEIFGGQKSNVERMTIQIPVSKKQYLMLDSVTKAYLNNTPYDYAFIGMRCGAAAYNVLSCAQIVKKRSRFGTYTRIFYPRKLRRKLMRKAKKNGWKIQKTKGTFKRKWERD